jgi:hyperosmotically inducible protein
MKSIFVIRMILTGAGIAAVSLGAGFAGARAASVSHTFVAQEPDNSGANQQQSAPGSATADQQKETPEDRELARKIRKSITDDSTLSTYAHNVKIIVQAGVVILKGPVMSEDEKKSVGAKAELIAGTGNVRNHLTVKS